MSPMTICEGLKELKIVMQPKPTYRATRLISAIARLSPPRQCEQRSACLQVGHRAGIGDQIAFLQDHLVDRGGGAVAFEASDVAAVARLAVDIDADMADFGGRSEGAVDDVAVVDHAEADAFADEVVGEVLGGDGGIEQVLAIAPARASCSTNTGTVNALLNSWMKLTFCHPRIEDTTAVRPTLRR